MIVLRKIAVTFAKKIFKRWNLDQFTQNSELDTKTPSDRPGNIFFYNSIFWPPWLRNFILKMNFPKVTTEFGPTISRGGWGCCGILVIFRIRFKCLREFAAKTVQNRTWVLLSCCGTGTTAVPVPVQLQNTGRSAVFELQIQILEFCERRRSYAVERCVTLPYRYY